MPNSAVSNTGPIIHLNEINLTSSLNIFQKVSIPKEVEKELSKKQISVPKNVEVKELNSESKDTVKILTNQHNLDLGESAAISLAVQEKADYFLTDDLDAREVAKYYNIEVHGSIGIILRNLRNKVINRKETIDYILAMKSKSSLFITRDLIDEVLDSIKDFKH